MFSKLRAVRRQQARVPEEIEGIAAFRLGWLCFALSLLSILDGGRHLRAQNTSHFFLEAAHYLTSKTLICPATRASVLG